MEVDLVSKTSGWLQPQFPGNAEGKLGLPGTRFAGK
jgi:hypothetical protein